MGRTRQENATPQKTNNNSIERLLKVKERNFQLLTPVE
jgi:hypothetical protein